MTAANSFVPIGAYLAGMVLGGVFFGGLWLTIRHTLLSAALGVWLIGSFVLRTVVALAGFYIVFAGDWRRLIACLLGFVVVRFTLARVLRVRNLDKRAAASEVSHAS